MNFTLERSLEILTRTPKVLNALLTGISADWTSANEGGETWSAYDVVGHLIHGEKTDWIPRIEIILSGKADKTFQPYNRFAQFEESRGKTLMQLLAEFARIREANVQKLKSKSLTAEHLEKTGIHPAFGQVTLAQLISTWTVHDLNHVAQISRVIARQYEVEVGPWKAYLGILKN